MRFTANPSFNVIPHNNSKFKLTGAHIYDKLLEIRPLVPIQDNHYTGNEVYQTIRGLERFELQNGWVYINPECKLSLDCPYTIKDAKLLSNPLFFSNNFINYV